ncbi:MAG TPA: class I SAM-dependent methyltransferase [Jatrophihabitans sp.]|jgi:SAM-dependent methyltransferase|uniref:class I SAM-dependent methyltransferase n=1 Tax=Jatrophihabitans sp. TaxID=1932789 RepID=UPI002EF743C9
MTEPRPGPDPQPMPHQQGRRHDLPASPFARSFGSQADRYDRARPSYPAAALDLALARPAGAGKAGRILDIGAGTGKLTATLLGRGAEVVAVEPDPQMLAVLADRLPQVRALAGSAERIPLPDRSVDAIVAGQAFHWFTRPDADREFARVLRPGGVVGLIWNFPDRSREWVSKLYQLTKQPEVPWADNFDPLDPALFGPAEQATLPFEHRLAGPEGLRDLVHTWSWVITRSQADQAVIDDRLRILISQYAELQAPVVVLPQHTTVVRQALR